MTLALAAIPENPDHLPEWLEQRIVSGELRALVAELAAVHGAAPPERSVRDEFDELLPTILTGGLVALPGPTRQAAARHLLQQPYHLLELQELVLTEGGPYWDAIPRPTELLVSVARVKARLAEQLLGPPAEPSHPTAPTPGPRKVPRYRSALVAVAATAALVCVATLAVTRILIPPRVVPTVPATTTGPTWGWARAGGMPPEADRARYLQELADRAGEWFDERPADPVALARRLSEFRQGCAVLQLAPHEPLSPDARAELKKRCGNWARAFDGYLARVEAGNEDPITIRNEADATVRKLMDALRTEAQKN
jgi:hypothetical protein